MAIVRSAIAELTRHALSKRGATQAPDCPPDEPCCRVAFVSPWNKFFELHRETEYDGQSEFKEIGRWLRLPAMENTLARHRERFPAVRASSWGERDGHAYLEIPVEADLPLDFLKQLIDEAHAIVFQKLDARGLKLTELSEEPYDERKLIDSLIDLHELTEYRREIRGLARQAVLLQTTKYEEDEIPLGASKIGGLPDLPAGQSWPQYRGEKPLSFLAQINLNEIARLPPPIPGLPKDGLLSVFSVWGWVGEGVETPADWGRQEELNFTVVIHTPSSAVLQRLAAPENICAYRAALVEPKAMLSLPNCQREPPVAKLGWPDELLDRFDSMQSEYRSLQAHQWRKQDSAMDGGHWLGGYAIFQQQFPAEVLKKNLAMFLQIGSDSYAGMCWEDGGELTFYACPKAMAAGRFERVWGTCQGG